MEDPAETAGYEHDWTVVLDDWIDGTGYTPDQVLDALRNGMGGTSMAAASPSMSSMSGMPSSASSSGPSPVLSGARSALLGGDAGDVRYPWYLINGRVASAPGRSPPAPASGPGSGSSTPPPIPASASSWAVTR